MIRTFNANEPVSFTFTLSEEASESFQKFVEEYPEYFTFKEGESEDEQN